MVVRFAANADGFPIFGPHAARGAECLLHDDATNHTQRRDGTCVLVQALTGEPMLDDGTIIDQPPGAYRLTLLVQDTLDARLVAGRIVPRMAPPGAMPANYGRTPARVSTNIIDYSRKEGIQMYRDTTRPLFRDSEASFDLSTLALHTFLNKVDHRGKSCGWTILNVIIDQASGHTRNLATHYGEVKLGVVRDAVSAFDSTYTLNV